MNANSKYWHKHSPSLTKPHYQTQVHYINFSFITRINDKFRIILTVIPLGEIKRIDTDLCMITRANAFFEFVAWMQHQELRVLISFITPKR